MVNELYLYACPKLSSEQKNQFNMFLVLCLSLYSFVSGFIDEIVFGIVVAILYFTLSLLTFLDKDFKSRYLKLTMLACIDISIASMYIFGTIYQHYQVISWSIIFGIIFFVIYEIVVFTKIKNKRYSSSTNNTVTNVAVSGSTIFLFVLIFRIFNRIPGLQFLLVMILVLLCAAIILFTMILIQKLIIYLFTRNKIQANFDDEKEINEIDKNN